MDKNALIKETIHYLTPSLWDRLAKHGLKIKFIDKKSYKKWNGAFVEDHAVHGCIYIYSLNIKTIIHEIGHFIFDHVKLSRNIKNCEIYNIFVEYREKLKKGIKPWSAYNRTTFQVGEYFAEGFAFYFCSPDKLYKEDKKLFDHIHKSIKHLLKL